MGGQGAGVGAQEYKGMATYKAGKAYKAKRHAYKHSIYMYTCCHIHIHTRHKYTCIHVTRHTWHTHIPDHKAHSLPITYMYKAHTYKNLIMSISIFNFIQARCAGMERMVTAKCSHACYQMLPKMKNVSKSPPSHTQHGETPLQNG